MRMILGATAALAQGTASQHVMTEANELTWGPPPPVFAQNAKFTVVSGDPGKAGLYVVRLDMPAGYKIAPHWHPTDERGLPRSRRLRGAALLKNKRATGRSQDPADAEALER